MPEHVIIKIKARQLQTRQSQVMFFAFPRTDQVAFYKH